MKKIIEFLLKNPKLLKIIAITFFMCFFIVTAFFATKTIFNQFKISLLFSILVIAELLFNEYITSIIKKKIKSFFPTTYLPNKLENTLDKFLDFGISLFLLCYGVSFINSYSDINIATGIKINLDYYALSLWVLIIYILGIGIGSTYYYYKREFIKLKNSN